MKIATVVVAYEAEHTIRDVLDRVPRSVAGCPTELIVFDDASTDRTVQIAQAWASGFPRAEVVRQPRNLGYGGNQKAAYREAIARGFDVAALVHGDGQYPPERLDDLVAPILENRADAVFGSRMLIPGGARRGGMPLTRRVGNRVMSRALDVLADRHLSEWFSGFRAYRLGALSSAGFDQLPDGFDFDTAIILELMRTDARIVENAVPTFYGDEISRVPLVRTGLAALGHGVRHRSRRSAVIN